MRGRHRLNRFRKNKRLRHQRFRSRVFLRDKMNHNSDENRFAGKLSTK